MAQRPTSTPVPDSRILAWLEANPGTHPAGDIGRGLGIRRHEKKLFSRQLAELAQRGLVERRKGDRYRLAQLKRLQGTVSLHRDGYGFLVGDDASQPDVFLPARELREVMHGDRLAVSVSTDAKGRLEGRLEQILQRARRELVGAFQAGRRDHLVIPFGQNAGQAIVVPQGETLQAGNGQVVVVRIRDYPRDGRPALGSVSRILGDRDDPAVDILVTAHRFGLPDQFSAEATAAAAGLSAGISDEDLAGRRDLRDTIFVTIDGETAKDFDDAVALREEPDGYRLWVAIADVAHYVKPGSALDRDALERGTSVYFPGSCLPMLPEQLSNGICSLMPDADRLVLVAEMAFTRQGKRSEAAYYPAVIRSRGRLTYRMVQDFLDHAATWPTSCPEIFPQLQSMARLTNCLVKLRRQRGGLDFELPEAEVVLDAAGRTLAIRKVERLFAHRLIEEFMLAANEAVASELEQRELPLLFRVHEPPSQDKLEVFQQFIAHFNYGLRLDEGSVDPLELQRLLDEVHGKPESRAINQVLLRSMKQACYQADNLGHFGLAMHSYCHFTSPIRRYPDLVVHRVLHGVFAGRQAYRHKDLIPLGEDLSRKERRAMDAERDLVALRKCQYMSSRLGETFAGVVSGVQPFGLFVELSEVFVEGLVHISALSDDYYHFDEALLRLIGSNRRRIFQVGDAVSVKLVRVDQESRDIDFALDDPAARSAEQSPRGRK